MQEYGLEERLRIFLSWAQAAARVNDEKESDRVIVSSNQQRVIIVMVQHSNLDKVVQFNEHLKNEKNSKKLANRGRFILGVSLVIILFIFATCNKEDEFEKFMRESPPVLTVVQVEKGLKISWNEVRGATSYVINSSENNFDDNTLQSSGIDVYETFYVDENPVEGVNYYKVRAIKRTIDNVYSTVYSSVVSFNYTTQVNK